MHDGGERQGGPPDEDARQVPIDREKRDRSAAMPPGPRTCFAPKDEVFLEAIDEILCEAGFETVRAEDGESALRMASDPSIGVVVLDVRLPDMDGIQVLARIREMRPDLSIIMLSASTDQEIVLDGFYRDRTEVSDDYGPARLYSRLRQNAEFRMLFADHIHRHLFNDGATTSWPSHARYKELADEIELAMISESARWGDQKSSTRPGVPGRSGWGCVSYREALNVSCVGPDQSRPLNPVLGSIKPPP